MNKKTTFGERVIAFNRALTFNGNLPENIRIMNPFAENPDALELSSRFYRKFYNDTNPRTLILGINPGRFGAGVTGIPFTDTKRLNENCGLSFPGITTHELSSVFVYDIIEAYGGVDVFYNDVYISSVCPLGFVITDDRGKEKNYNYYDSMALQNAALPFIKESLEKQCALGIRTDVCYCLGSGKNYKFLFNLNKEIALFKKIVPLEHPRYVMQYRLRQKDAYIKKFVDALRQP